MNREIRFSMPGSALFSWLALTAFAGVVVYGASVLLGPGAGTLASPAYWMAVVAAMFAVLLARLFIMSEQVTGIVFGEHITVHRLMQSSRRLEYGQLHEIRLDDNRHEVSMDAGHDGKVDETIEFPAIPPEQEKLLALFLRHGFTEQPGQEDDQVRILCKTGPGTKTGA